MQKRDVVTVGLVLALAGGAAAAEMTPRLAAAQARHCQAIGNMMGAVAEARRGGVSLTTMLQAVEDRQREKSASDAEESATTYQHARERITRIYVAGDPEDEARQITAECLIAVGLVRVN
jgi:hypothetical protein